MQWIFQNVIIYIGIGVMAVNLTAVALYFFDTDTTEWRRTIEPNGPMMRRKINGEWQYRPLNKDEELEYIDR